MHASSDWRVPHLWKYFLKYFYEKYLPGSPEKTVFIVELDGSHSPGEITDNPLQESIMNSETHEHLELVILAQSAAGGLYLCDQLGVHPPQLRGPGHGAAHSPG